MSPVEPKDRTCVSAPHAEIQDSETQDCDDPPIEHSRNSSCGILDEAEGDERTPASVSEILFCCRNIDEEYADAYKKSQTPLQIREKS
jgi:hypothetical protein